MCVRVVIKAVGDKRGLEGFRVRGDIFWMIMMLMMKKQLPKIAFSCFLIFSCIKYRNKNIDGIFIITILIK